MNSQTVQSIIYYGNNVDKLGRIVKGTLKMKRKGQIQTIDNADLVLAPTLVGGNHWVCFVINRNHWEISLINSLPEESAPDSEGVAKALANFMSALEIEIDNRKHGLEDELNKKELDMRDPYEREYIYRNQLQNFPMQNNWSDCGIFTFLAVYSIATDKKPAVDQTSIVKWRSYLTMLLLSNAEWGDELILK